MGPWADGSRPVPRSVLGLGAPGMPGAQGGAVSGPASMGGTLGPWPIYE